MIGTILVPLVTFISCMFNYFYGYKKGYDEAKNKYKRKGSRAEMTLTPGREKELREYASSINGYTTWELFAEIDQLRERVENLRGAINLPFEKMFKPINPDTTIHEFLGWLNKVWAEQKKALAQDNEVELK